jgi:hypothetical protein
LLIDGVPGLGKTKFADFAVESKLAGAVYKVDMTSMLKYPFSKVLLSIYHDVQINTSTIFMIDEVDKYIDYRVVVEYDEEVDNSKEEDKIISKSFDEFKIHAKTTFLYDMLSILERDGTGFPVIVIFCSNNFHSIFEGLDITHHKSLYDRFMKIKFKECNHSEIINYIMYYNKIFKGTKYENKINQIEIENKLKRDILVTHRTLHHISVEAKYYAYDMIKLLNAHVSEDDSGEGLVEKIVKIKDNLINKKNVGVNLMKNNEEPQRTDKKFVDKQIKNSIEDITSNKSIKIKTDNNNSDTEILIDDENYVIADYQKLWNEKYNPKEELSATRGKEIVGKIAGFLGECEKYGTERGKQIGVVVNLFDYLSNEGYLIMDNPGFFSGVVGKIEEFYYTVPEIFQLLSNDTKQFIYAASGIKCD